ncbi:MAG: hypothetical protein RL189_3319, partial [Pseudomonadota bacterium]
GSSTLSREAYRCNPSLLRSISKSAGIVELTTLAQESTFRALWKLATEPLTGADIARLFSEYNFSTYSGFARLATVSPWFALEYIPFSLTGAYRITNPSLPFIQVTGLKKQAFSLTTGLQSDDFFERQTNTLSTGIKVSFEDIQATNVNIDTISAITAKNRDFVATNRSKRLVADLGLSWLPKTPWFPNVGATCRNCFSSTKNGTSERSLDISKIDSRTTDFHSSWQWSPSLGTVWGSFGLFWDDFYRSFRWETSSIAAGYRIGELNVTGALGPTRTAWGLSMQRDVYHMSLHYAFEKQPAMFRAEWNKNLYISLGAAL